MTDFKHAIAELAKGAPSPSRRCPTGSTPLLRRSGTCLGGGAEDRGVVLVHAARDGRRACLQRGLVVAAPEIELLDFPAWDCPAL